MFGKPFVLLIYILAFGFSGGIASAQFLVFDGEQHRDGSVTVGTTTYNFDLPQSSLKSAQVRLQEIYTYIRDFDSVEIVSPVRNSYSDISNMTFGSRQSTDVTAFPVNTKCKFTKDLTLGSKSEEVLKLQKFLNQYPETRVAEVGIGAPGNETDYFGTLTLNAVFAFQAKHANMVLVPIGLTNPTGYWGQATRTFANTLLGC